MSTLESVDWGKPARHLLESTRNLEAGKPAVMHIRHTARMKVTREEAQQNPSYDQSLHSTPEGIQAAIDFGSSLPKDRRYTLYHTYFERARETADAIRRGILDTGGRAEMGGVIPCKTQIDPEANVMWVKRQRWFPEDGGFNITCQWIAGLRPSATLKPSQEYSLEMAKVVMENLSGASPDALHLYVSHDDWVQVLFFHWFGAPPQLGGLRFLDGFMMQLLDVGVKTWFRGGCVVYDYPYWWPR